MTGAAQADLDSLSTAVLTFDGHCRLQAINVAAETLLSLSRRQVLGTPASVLWCRTPDFLHTLQRCLNSGDAYRERNFHLQLAEGRSCQVDYALTPIRTGERIDGLSLEMNPAPDPRTLQPHEEQHQYHRDSLRGLAHEIRNPLGGIRGAAQLLERALSEPALREYTAIIIRETDRLRQFVDTLLTGEQINSRQQASIHELLEYVTGLLMAETAGAARVARDYDPSLPDVHLDRQQLIRALLNLLRNAWQGVGAQGLISLRTRAVYQQTVLQVQYPVVLALEVLDDGPAIPQAVRSGMFYPLVSGREKGTGLGLPIARQLLRQHDGDIAYERLATGNCFRVLLPLSRGRGSGGNSR